MLLNKFKRRIIISQIRLTHYRVPFFERLRLILSDSGIDLILLYGQPSTFEKIKHDEGFLPWAFKVKNRYWQIGGRDICWQPLPLGKCDADLVIVTQENRILSNYPKLLARRFGGPKVAYWGHGLNLQSTSPTSMRERWKKFWLRRVDWWFAYTQLTVDHLMKSGFPINRITCVNNAIDTKNFNNDLQSVKNEELTKLRDHLGISPNDLVGIYCGSLYSDKRLDLLIAASDYIHAAKSDFRLIIVGEGPDGDWIRNQILTRPWAYAVGVKKAREKALYFRLAKVQLNPGMVGLGILDAFTAGLPLVTTSSARHSPEIAYLFNRKNGLVVGDRPEEYGQSVLELLQDKSLYDTISAASLQSSKFYSIENMASRFADGIIRCLQ